MSVVSNLKTQQIRHLQIPVGFITDISVCVSQPKTLKPKKVLLRQNNMTSVLAVTHKNWMVFFIGTGDGQLIKVGYKKCYISVVKNLYKGLSILFNALTSSLSIN